MAGATHAGRRRPSRQVLLPGARGGGSGTPIITIVLRLLRSPGRDRRVPRLIRTVSPRVCRMFRNGRRCWQARKDLNPHQAGWSRVCCRYTTGLCWLPVEDLNLAYLIQSQASYR